MSQNNNKNRKFQPIQSNRNNEHTINRDPRKYIFHKLNYESNSKRLFRQTSMRARNLLQEQFPAALSHPDK